MAAADKQAEIALALFARVASVGLAYPMQFPEPAEVFTPPDEAPYLVIDLFGNTPRWRGLNGASRDQGLLMVTVVWPRAQGLVKPKRAVGVIIEHFRGQQLRNGTTTVTIEPAPWDAAPLTGPDRISVPVTIPWSA